jgi:hypothetical protein
MRVKTYQKAGAELPCLVQTATLLGPLYLGFSGNIRSFSSKISSTHGKSFI